VLEGDGALEHVVLFGRGMGRLDTQQIAQLAHEALGGRQLGRHRVLPALDECQRRGVVGLRVVSGSHRPHDTLAQLFVTSPAKDDALRCTA
jgi:hypothetical protein